MGQNLKIRRFTVEFTRQADTTTYAAQDVVGPVSSGVTALVFAPVHADDSTGKWLSNGASYQIKSAKLSKSTSNTTNATFDLYLYTSGITSQFDNQPKVLTYANKHVRIGKIPFTMVTASSSSTASDGYVTDSNITFRAIRPNANVLITQPKVQGIEDATIYGELIVTGAYTPGASENFFIELEILEINE